MGEREQEFLQSLRATFRVEAGEHLQVITTGLFELEKAKSPERRRPVIEEIFRAAHSLKGASRAVNFTDIESSCQLLEELFAAWKRGEKEPVAEALDGAHRVIDRITAALLPMANTPAPTPPTPPPSQVAQPKREPTPQTPPPPIAVVARPVTPSSTDGETVRVPLSTLDSRLLEAEELLSAKLFTAERASELGSLAAGFEPWHKAWAKAQHNARMIRTRNARHTNGTESHEEIDCLVDFLEWNSEYVRGLENRIAALRRAADQDRFSLGKLVDDVLENAKKLVMLPLATLGSLLPKVVRDLSRDQGKEAELVLRGEDVKIDKRILDEMKDPLVHLLRNCVDHGVEMPEDRRRAGKPERATIMLIVSSIDGNHIEILVSDDGRGIDVSHVKNAAIRQGLMGTDHAQVLSDSAALALIFEPDLSTSPIITQVSGRGLGLAIVREKTERLGGRVTVDSAPGAGTSIRITLPLTLATFRGVLVQAEQRCFVIPTAQVERVARFKPEDVQTVEGRETLALYGRALSLVRLGDVLKLPPAQRPADAPPPSSLLVLGSGEQRMAVVVDAIVDEREVLLKPLRKPLSRVRNVLGATVLGNGDVAPVLNVSDLLKSARSAGSPVRALTSAPTLAAEAKRILVAEDSITSRMLLKGILESAGYRVKTAVDGMEAFTVLRTEDFDALVSDVEMPRLNGFDLTARIRADRKLAELPVVLVTALESREHRERGVDVGANAYLVKSALDQTNLLEALRRLA